MNIETKSFSLLCSAYNLMVRNCDTKGVFQVCDKYSGRTKFVIDSNNDSIIFSGTLFTDICEAIGFVSMKYNIHTNISGQGNVIFKITKQETYTKERACNYINYVCKQKFSDYKEDNDRSFVLEMVEDEKVWDEDTFGYIKHLMKGCSSFLDFRKYVLKNKIDCTLAKYGRN